MVKTPKINILLELGQIWIPFYQLSLKKIKKSPSVSNTTMKINAEGKCN